MAAPSEVPIQHPSIGTNGTTMPASNGLQDKPSGQETLATGLSADEIALYDRQIRLWGAQAQERIRSANILLVSLRALGTEIAKNLTLAGIRSLTIIDDGIVTEEDLGAQFFLRESDLGKPRAEAALPRIQDLNPRVTVKSDGGLTHLLATQNEHYYAAFDLIIACDADILTLSTINSGARLAAKPFYAAGIHGFYGYIFADLVAHTYVLEREKSNVPTRLGMESPTRAVLSCTTRRETSGKTTEIVQKRETYCPLLLANSSPLAQDILSNRRKLKSVPALLPALRALFEFQRDFGRLPGHSGPDLVAFTTSATTKAAELQLPPETLKADFLRSFIGALGAEIAPTAAFVGGRLSEDVINVLGQREQPVQNFALFDGEALEGRILCLYSNLADVAGVAMGEVSLGVPGGGVPGSGAGVGGAMNGAAAGETIILD